MKVDNAMIDRLSHLARLEFTETEKEEVKTELSKILTFVEKLNELNTDGIEPLIYVNEEINVLRKDEAQSTITKAEALKNAPQKDSDYFKVPKVISKK